MIFDIKSKTPPTQTEIDAEKDRLTVQIARCKWFRNWMYFAAVAIILSAIGWIGFTQGVGVAVAAVAAAIVADVQQWIVWVCMLIILVGMFTGHVPDMISRAWKKIETPDAKFLIVSVGLLLLAAAGGFLIQFLCEFTDLTLLAFMSGYASCIAVAMGKGGPRLAKKYGVVW